MRVAKNLFPFRTRRQWNAYFVREKNRKTQTTAPNAKRRCAAETSVDQQLDMLIIRLEIARTPDWRPRVIHAFNVACSRQAFPEPLGVGAQDSVRQIACLGILLYSQVLRFITGRICRVKTVLIWQPDVRGRPRGSVHEIHDFRFPSLNREYVFFK
jgi:hypothetical protein